MRPTGLCRICPLRGRGYPSGDHPSPPIRRCWRARSAAASTRTGSSNSGSASSTGGRWRGTSSTCWNTSLPFPPLDQRELGELPIKTLEPLPARLLRRGPEAALPYSDGQLSGLDPCHALARIFPTIRNPSSSSFSVSLVRIFGFFAPMTTAIRRVFPRLAVATMWYPAFTDPAGFQTVRIGVALQEAVPVALGDVAVGEVLLGVEVQGFREIAGGSRWPGSSCPAPS